MAKRQIPTSADTEAEMNLCLNASMNQLTLGSQTANATKSVFNITLEEGLENNNSAQLKDYEKRLQEEIKGWSALWRSSVQQLKEFQKNAHPIVDVSQLSAEKREYIDKAPDLQRFLRDSIEFRQLAHVFLEKDYMELQEMQQNLIEICEHAATVVKESKIAQNLANK